MLSIPRLIAGLVIVAITGPSITGHVVLTGTVYAATVFRVARALALNVVTLDYVHAAHVRGEGWLWLTFGEVLPNVAALLAADFALRLSFCILFISNMSFLGMGLQPPAADWGSLVRENLSGLASTRAMIATMFAVHCC
jgi:peptide/nickel transport system permease protein